MVSLGRGPFCPPPLPVRCCSPHYKPPPQWQPLLPVPPTPNFRYPILFHANNHKEFTPTDSLPDSISLGIHLFKTSYLEEILVNMYVF